MTNEPMTPEQYLAVMDAATAGPWTIIERLGSPHFVVHPVEGYDPETWNEQDWWTICQADKPEDFYAIVAARNESARIIRELLAGREDGLEETRAALISVSAQLAEAQAQVLLLEDIIALKNRYLPGQSPLERARAEWPRFAESASTFESPESAGVWADELVLQYAKRLEQWEREENQNAI